MHTLPRRNRALRSALHASTKHVHHRTSTTAAATTNSAPPKALSSILIANRGEIALRVARTASSLGIRTTALYTSPDAHSQHATSTPFAVNLGADTRAYLDGQRILELAQREGCGAIHPGYGFLSENADFARLCDEQGITFIGPPWQAIDAMGDKSRSKEIMNAAGVPCIPGYHGTDQGIERLEKEAEKVGYPVLIKAVKGGGGKGMRIVNAPSDFRSQLDSAKSEARNSFGDDAVLVERYISAPRHIEVQVFADSHGNCVALGERDCSVQRRHQKILEESPAPGLNDELRKDIWQKARKAALAVGYRGAGTVEFIFDNETGDFFFMEMNTRLQVEHPVTEMVTGEDLVRWQIAVAEGAELPLSQEQIEEQISQRGAAIEARIYAENPDMNFMPDSGTLTHLRTPPETADLRIDAGFRAGDTVSAHYDPMIAKLIVRGPTRASALQRLLAALEEYEIAGPSTNIEFLKRVIASPAFARGGVETGFIEQNREELFAQHSISDEVLAQAAVGIVLSDANARPEASESSSSIPLGSRIGFETNVQKRTVQLLEPLSSSLADEKPMSHAVSVHQTAPETFTIVTPNQTFQDVYASYDAASHTLTSFYPHTRLNTSLIRSTVSSTTGPSESVVLFQRGTKFNLAVAPPDWLAAALGTKSQGESVKTPMPCKVLRVDVSEGDGVTKGQTLVVVESMKMEMAISSPVDGVVRRVVHSAGDICAAGTALVEFVEEES